MNARLYLMLAQASMLLSDAGTGSTDGTDIKIEADMGGANILMKGLTGPVGLILGVMVWIILVGIVIYTAFEIMYIVFPIMQGAISGEGKQGKGIDKIVSGDAKKAVEVGNRGEGNPLVYYLKHRIIVYVVLGILIVLLVTGNAFKLIKLGEKGGQGVVDMIDSSGSDTSVEHIDGL